MGNGFNEVQPEELAVHGIADLVLGGLGDRAQVSYALRNAKSPQNGVILAMFFRILYIQGCGTALLATAQQFGPRCLLLARGVHFHLRVLKLICRGVCGQVMVEMSS